MKKVKEVEVEDFSSQSDQEHEDRLSGELDYEEETVNEKTGACINDDCMHFDKTLELGCGCGGQDDDPPFDVHGCLNFVQGMVDASESIPSGVETHSTGEASETFLRELPVSLSDEELADKGEEMARLINIWTREKLNLKAYTKSAKSLIDPTEEQYIQIAEEVACGSEERKVACFWLFNFTEGTKTLIRTDTNEEVETKTLTPDEYQQDLNLSIANVNAAFPDNENLCNNIECGSYNAEEPNHCDALEYVFECELRSSALSVSTTVEGEAGAASETIEEVQS